MPDGRDKQQSRANRQVVRTLFLEVWDPIGVRGIPEASDEYDSYANAAYVMLMEGADAEAIEAYLVGIAAEHMGLGRKAHVLERSRITSQRLVAMRPGFLAR